jgi:hypothetical protein
VGYKKLEKTEHVMNKKHGDQASSDHYILLYKGRLNIVIKFFGDRTRAEFNTLPLLYHQCLIERIQTQVLPLNISWRCILKAPKLSAPL